MVCLVNMQWEGFSSLEREMICSLNGRLRYVQVALKSMMVIHRTLREGDPTFREELINYGRNRGHILNLSNFKDDSSPHGSIVTTMFRVRAAGY